MVGPRVFQEQRRTCSVHAVGSRLLSTKRYTLLPSIPLFTPFYGFTNLQGLPGIFTVFTQHLPLRNISHALSSHNPLLSNCLCFPISLLGLSFPIPFLGACSPIPFFERRSASRRPLIFLVDRIQTLRLSQLFVYLSFTESSIFFALLSVYLSLQYLWRSVIPNSLITKPKARNHHAIFHSDSSPICSQHYGQSDHGHCT